MDTPHQLHREPRASRVFLVEDSALIRERLLALLQGVDGVEVVGDADSAAEAVDGIVATSADVVVLDIKLRNSSGLEVLKRIKHLMPNVAVVMLTNYATPEYRDACRQAGATHFLDKTNEFENLRGVLQQLSRDNQPGDKP